MRGTEFCQAGFSAQIKRNDEVVMGAVGSNDGKGSYIKHRLSILANEAKKMFCILF